MPIDLKCRIFSVMESRMSDVDIDAINLAITNKNAIICHNIVYPPHLNHLSKNSIYLYLYTDGMIDILCKIITTIDNRFLFFICKSSNNSEIPLNDVIQVYHDLINYCLSQDKSMFKKNKLITIIQPDEDYKHKNRSKLIENKIYVKDF